MALREARCDICDRWNRSSRVAEAQKPELQNVIYKVTTLLVHLDCREETQTTGK